MDGCGERSYIRKETWVHSRNCSQLNKVPEPGSEPVSSPSSPKKVWDHTYNCGWCWDFRKNCFSRSKCVWIPGPGGPGQPDLCADIPSRYSGRSWSQTKLAISVFMTFFLTLNWKIQLFSSPNQAHCHPCVKPSLMWTFSKFGKDVCLLDLKPGFLHNGNPQRMRKWFEENRYLLKVMIWAVCWT